MSTLAINRANIRMNAFGRKSPKTVSGTVVLADTTAVTIVTGLKTVTQATATASAGATAIATVITKPASPGGTITLKGASAGTFDWIAVGY